MQNKIMVSIICTTYNHENYIADAMESFLMQTTDFSYEILIHDDASTDGTTEIIKKFESKYPDLIKPIYQKENQYSKGIKVGRLNSERAQGKYIALCEGDDYWTDHHKLQKQVEYMEKHPECSMCVHASYRISPENRKLKSHIRPNCGDKNFSVDEIILGGGGLFATNSTVFPTVFSTNRPDFFENAPVGDYPLAIYLALQGKVYYMDEFMSAYRVNVKGSWTDRNSTIERRIEHIDKIANMLNEVNRYSEYMYDLSIKKTIRNDKFELILDQGMFKEAREGEFKDLFAALDLNSKTKIFLKQYCPRMTKFLILIKKKLNR